MSKQEFLAGLAALYRVANRADRETCENWTRPEMAGTAGCAGFDSVLRGMVKCGAISEVEKTAFYDSL